MTVECLLPQPDAVQCGTCKRSLDAFKAAYWACASCGQANAWCFLCDGSGAYALVDAERAGHRCVIPLIRPVPDAGNAGSDSETPPV